jgi:hypothetical protein
MRLRRRTAYALTAVPFAVALLVYGCSAAEPPVENLCNWLADSNNCYRAFFRDVEPRACGGIGPGSAPKGSFLARDKLDVCVLDGGGQVLFDPPPTVDQFPLQTTSFKLISADGTECGTGSYQSLYGFSISVDPYPPPSAASPTDAGAADGGTAGPVIQGGAYSQVKAPSQDLIDTTCPSGEAHHFDLVQGDKCPQYAGVMPRAELESSAGGIDPVAGYVRFRVYFPPADTSDVANAPGTVVEYFDCAVPPAPKPCVDGVQDGTETDVDCGGTCPAQCAAGQKCLTNADCQTGLCQFVAGLKTCAAPGAGGAGGGASATGGAGGAPSTGTGGAAGKGGAGGTGAKDGG